MLLEMTVKNIALIDTLRVEFSSGLNVLTGETGAGKSIVVDAMNLALGARFDRELLRSGADKASVEAVFAPTNREALSSLLEEMGVEMEEDLLIIRRELTAAGRSVCRLNGGVMTVQQLRRVTALLVDVHGQHEHQSLLNPAKHIDLLDAFGDEAHFACKRAVAEAYEAYANVRRELDRRQLDEAERERLLDSYHHQMSEIEAVKPKRGEDEKLEQQNRLLEHGEKIVNGIGTAYRLIYEGEARQKSVQEALRRSAEAMGAIAPIDQQFDGIYNRINDLYYAAQDVGYELQDIQEGLDYEPDKAERVADRLDSLKRLMRKYGPSLNDVLSFYEDVKRKFQELEGGEEQLSELKAELSRREQALHQAAQALSESRRGLARTLSAGVLKELKDLGMERTRFEVRFLPAKAPGPEGRDAVEFLISPNPGEPLKSLSAIASGGELSRIMLAIKVLSADLEGVDTMIFDEIDTGVSGRMAQIVGEKMAAVAKGRQVICVTHLPQIAALANNQYLVEKTVTGERTGSTVRRLDRQGRIEELARMVGGAGELQSSLTHAEHLLDAGQKLISDRV